MSASRRDVVEVDGVLIRVHSGQPTQADVAALTGILQRAERRMNLPRRAPTTRGEMMDTTSDSRTTAGIRDTDDKPIGRDDYAHLLEGEVLVLGGPAISIKAAEAFLAASLLDELAAIYRGEQLGRLARELAVKLYDRLGI